MSARDGGLEEIDVELTRSARIAILGIMIAAAPFFIRIEVPGAASPYVPHVPISIYGDEGFTAANGVVGGLGTAFDPYVIQGWEINASTAAGIAVQNTHLPFVIRNVYVHSGGFAHDGISLSYVANARVKNSTISGNYRGINVYASDANVEILGNRVSDNWAGIELGWSTNVTLTANEFTSDRITMLGNSALHFDSHTITPDNSVRGRPLYFYHGCIGLDLDSTAAGAIIVTDCSRVHLANLTISGADVGVLMAYVDGVVITGSNLSGNRDGIELLSAKNVTVTNTSFRGNNNGIEVESSRDLFFRENVFSNGVNGVGGVGVTNIVLEYNAAFNNSGFVRLNSLGGGAFAHNHAWGNGDGIDLGWALNVSIIDNNLSNNGTDLGLLLSDRVNVLGNNLTADGYGILHAFSTNSTIVGNRFTGNYYGLYLSGSKGTHVAGNVFTSTGVYLVGDSLLHFNSQTVTADNLVNGEPLLYYKDCPSLSLSAIAVGQLIVVNCRNVRAADLHIADTNAGILMAYVVGATIEGNNVSNNRLGLAFAHSSDVTITANIIAQNDEGLRFEYSSGMRVHHNNFINNTRNAVDSQGTGNSWDDGYPGGGNFWSNYTGDDRCSGPGQNLCPDSDGIGDTPYPILGGGQDRYPLVGPYLRPALSVPIGIAIGLAIGLASISGFTVYFFFIRKKGPPKDPGPEPETGDEPGRRPP